MTSTDKNRVIKLQESETLEFLELYAAEQVLYDVSVEEYKYRCARMAAAERISDALQIPGFGPKAVIAKFKNLRSSYCQELKKIARSERCGAGTDVYKPKIFWFDKMNSFIRPYVQQRSTLSNKVSPTNSKEPSRLKQSQSPSMDFSATDGLDETKPSASQVPAGTVTPRAALKRKIHSSSPPPLSIIRKRVLHEPQIDILPGAVDKLQATSNRAAVMNQEDCYDYFGKYVASMLRNIGPPVAMRLQESITSQITNAMCPSPTSSNQSTLPSGRESNMGDDY